MRGITPGGAVSDRNHAQDVPATTVPSAAPTSRHNPTNPTSASTGETGVEDPG